MALVKPELASDYVSVKKKGPQVPLFESQEDCTLQTWQAVQKGQAVAGTGSGTFILDDVF